MTTISVELMLAHLDELEQQLRALSPDDFQFLPPAFFPRMADLSRFVGQSINGSGKPCPYCHGSGKL